MAAENKNLNTYDATYESYEGVEMYTRTILNSFSKHPTGQFLSVFYLLPIFRHHLMYLS